MNLSEAAKFLERHALELSADKYSASASVELRNKEIARVNAVTIPVMTIEHEAAKFLVLKA